MPRLSPLPDVNMISLLTSCLLVLAAAERPQHFRDLDLDAALAAAAAEKKVVLVAFQPADDAESQKLDKVTWKDSKVKKWIEERAVALVVDPAEDAALAARFHVHAFPTLVFVKADGTEVDRIVGGVDAKAFREEADAILGGADPLVRLRKLVAGHADDPEFHLDLARLLFDRGIFDESAKEYLWCFDEGVKRKPAFQKTRNGAVLDEIVRLGRVYPAALDGLAERGEAIALKIPDCTALASELSDFARIQKALQRPERVLGVYDSVGEAECGAIVRSALLPQILGALVDQQRYAEALTGIGDAKTKLAQHVQAFEAARAKSKSDRTSLDALDLRRTEIRLETLVHHQALVGAKQSKSANELADALVAFDRCAPTYLGLVRSSEMAGDKGLARAIAEKALADPLLADTDKATVGDKTAALRKSGAKAPPAPDAQAPAGSGPVKAKQRKPVDDEPN